MQELRNEEGSSLIEVSIAIASAAVLMLGVMASFTTSNKQDRDAFEETRSQNVCSSMMEQIESLEFEELANYAGLTVVQEIEKWTFTIQVVQIQTDLLAIHVTVSTTNNHDAVPDVELMTLKTIKDESLLLS